MLQFEIIRNDLENAKKKIRLRKYDLYDYFLCSVVKEESNDECQDFPNWYTGKN